MGEGCKKPGSVPGVRFAAAGPSMAHAVEHVSGIEKDLMAAAALDVCNKANAATVFFVAWVVQPRFFWKAFKGHYLGL